MSGPPLNILAIIHWFTYMYKQPSASRFLIHAGELNLKINLRITPIFVTRALDALIFGQSQMVYADEIMLYNTYYKYPRVSTL